MLHVSGLGFGGLHSDTLKYNVVPATFLGETYASCVVPTSRHPGKVSFEITTNGVDFSDSKISYEYHNRVVMAVAVPEQGPSNGGTSVTIYGSNFENTTRLRCRFGNLAVNATFQSRSEIEIDLKQDGVEQNILRRRSETETKILSIEKEVNDSIEDKESTWRKKALVWLNKARRKFEAKAKSDAERIAAKKRRM
eukprot:g2915.t1